MRRTWAFLGVLALMALPPAAAAPTEEVAYRFATQDLFPEDADLDVALTVTATVFWRLVEAPSGPDGTGMGHFEPVAGPLEVDVAYRYRRACCAEQTVQGSERLRDWVPLAGGQLPQVLLDDRVLELRLDASLEAATRAAGAGSVAPPTLTWDEWMPRALQVSLDGGFLPGDAVQVLAATKYTWRITADLAGPGEAPRAAHAQGTAPGGTQLSATFAVAQEAQEPARGSFATPGLPLAGAALAVAGAALLTRARRRSP